MNLLASIPIPRRTMVLFFLVDTSGSMSGSKIGAVNEAVRDVIPEIIDISENNPDSHIKIAVLEFSDGARWITDSPVDSDNFVWSSLDASGLTDLGSACEMLNDKLSRDEFMNETVGSFAPAIFLMSDGEPTDDYRRGLTLLQNNKWFKAAIKVAVAIGNDANKNVLTEFTGNSECVLTVHNPDALRKMIRFASITSSLIGSNSSQNDVTKASQFTAKINQFAAENIDTDNDEDDGW